MRLSRDRRPLGLHWLFPRSATTRLHARGYVAPAAIRENGCIAASDGTPYGPQTQGRNFNWQELEGYLETMAVET